MTGKLLTLSDLVEGQTEIVRDRPIEVRPAPEPHDDKAEIAAHIAWEHEKTDRIRALHGLPPLYTEQPDVGECSPWRAR